MGTGRINQSIFSMSINRPTSNERPGDQSSKTPSGKTVPMAMSMMVDSMVRMIQKGSVSEQNSESDELNHKVDSD